MKTSLNRLLRLGITTACLLTLSIPATTHAASNTKVYVYDYYKDAAANVEIYSISEQKDSDFTNAVVSKMRDGSYARWQDAFKMFWINDEGIIQLGGYDDPEGEYTYDTSSETILRKNIYEPSPDGKFGILERSRHKLQLTSKGIGAGIMKIRDFYLKNNQTGAVNLYYSTPNGFSTRWYDEHTLLETGYSETARQNVISAYDPVTGQRKELLKGTLYNFNRDTGKLLYALNEPLRNSWIYNIKTGTSRLQTINEDLSLYFPGRPSRPQIKLPDGVQLDQLPVVQIPIQQKYEYTVNVDNQSIPVSTVFTKDNTAWIPVRPLAEALGWTIEIIEHNTSYKAATYEYLLTSGTKKIILQPANSFNTGGRLFMTTAEVNSLGYSQITLTPVIE